MKNGLFGNRSNLPQDKVLILQRGRLKVGLRLRPKVEHEFLFDLPGIDLLMNSSNTQRSSGIFLDLMILKERNLPLYLIKILQRRRQSYLLQLSKPESNK